MGQVYSAATGRRITGSGSGGSGARHGGGEGSRNKQEMPYRYPPKSGGAYFANHFIMGGEKFDSPQPESFLFGENSDLNFLGGQPVPFPYPPPQANEPTKTLRSLVNIRRDSLHFVLAPTSGTSSGNASKTATPSLSKGTSEEGEDDETMADDDDNTIEDETTQVGPEPKEIEDDDDDEDDVDETTNVRKKHDKTYGLSSYNSKAKVMSRRKKRYNLQFTFDADVRCAITISYFCSEEITTQACTYSSKKPEICSETYYYNRGAGQIFSQPTHIFRPGIHQENLLQYSPSWEDVAYPVVIQMVALEHSIHGDAGCPRQSHATVATVEVTSDGNGFMLKPLKQKLFVDGLIYLLQEIYGLENKCIDDCDEADDSNSLNGGKSSSVPYDDDDIDDSGADCVVCMCEIRDTIILPCRHLCLCYTCAESLRFQANNCPICRAPFRALLQLRAVQKLSHAAHPALAGADPAPGLEGVPAGYMNVSLVEALNGPSAAALAAAAAATAAPSPLPMAMSLTSASSHTSSGHGRKNHRSRKPKTNVGSGSSNSAIGISNTPGTSRTRDGENGVDTDINLKSDGEKKDFTLRVALPPEALPATVLEMDETEKGVSEQPRARSKNQTKDGYKVDGIKLPKLKHTKGSSLSVSKSDDLVEEELENMEKAESLDVMSTNNIVEQQIEGLSREFQLPYKESNGDDESFDTNIVDAGSDNSDVDDLKEDEEDDEAVVIALPMVSSSGRPSGKSSPILPGTPISNTSSSARSSQDSSSASSTKQLLPKPATIISVVPSPVPSSVTVVPTPVTIIPASAATILNVATSETDEETC